MSADHAVLLGLQVARSLPLTASLYVMIFSVVLAPEARSVAMSIWWLQKKKWMHNKLLIVSVWTSGQLMVGIVARKGYALISNVATVDVEKSAGMITLAPLIHILPTIGIMMQVEEVVVVL
jgi:hypothetical protein